MGKKKDKESSRSRDRKEIKKLKKNQRKLIEELKAFREEVSTNFVLLSSILYPFPVQLVCK